MINYFKTYESPKQLKTADDYNCFDFMVKPWLPRIETMLFTDLKLEDYLLHSVSIEEELVKSQIAAFRKFNDELIKTNWLL